MTLRLPVSRVPPLIISSIGRYGVGIANSQLVGGAPGAVSWAANIALFVPIVIDHPVVIDKVFWINNGTSTNTVCVGVYNQTWSRLVTSGSTTQSGSAGIQTVSVTNYFLTPGRYYFAMSSNTTTSLVGSTSGVGRVAAMGVLEQATAHPLPDPASPGITTRTFVPVMGIVPRWP